MDGHNLEFVTKFAVDLQTRKPNTPRVHYNHLQDQETVLACSSASS